MIDTLIYNSFILSTIFNGSIVDSIEGCNKAAILLTKDIVKVELQLDTIKRVVSDKITLREEHRTFILKNGILTFDRPNGEAEMLKYTNLNNNSYINIIFKQEQCK